MTRKPDPADYVTVIGYPPAGEGPLQVLSSPKPAGKPS